MSKEAEIDFTRQAQIELKKYAEDNGLHIREIVDEKIGDRYPMFWAAKYGKVTVIDLLITMYRGKVNARHSTGKTPLDFAIEFGHEEAVRYLQSRGAKESSS